LWEVPVAGLLSTDMFNLRTPDGRQVLFEAFQGECQSSAVYAETMGTVESLSSVEHREVILKNGDQTRAFHLQGVRLAAGAGDVVTIISAWEEHARSAAARRLDLMVWTAWISIVAGFAILIFVNAIAGLIVLLLGLVIFFGVRGGNRLLKQLDAFVLVKNHTTGDRFLLLRGRRVRLIVGPTWLQVGASILMLLGIAAGLLMIGVGLSSDASSGSVAMAAGLIVLVPSLLVARTLRNKTRELQMLFDGELLNIERAADRAYTQRPVRAQAG
jgi:hypothetical protein